MKQLSMKILVAAHSWCEGGLGMWRRASVVVASLMAMCIGNGIKNAMLRHATSGT